MRSWSGKSLHTDAARTLARFVCRRLPSLFARLALICVALLAMAPVGLDAATPIARESPPSGNEPFFLVASPDMPDPMFQQTVILMLPVTQKPLVVGIIVNKPTKVTLAQLFKESADFKNRSEPVYFGGPVEITSPIVLVRASKEPDSTTRLFQNVYISADADAVDGLMKRAASAHDARLFLGRAQWSVDQLHGEMLRGAWTTASANVDSVFSSDPTTVWPALSKQSKLREVDLFSDTLPGLDFRREISY